MSANCSWCPLFSFTSSNTLRPWPKTTRATVTQRLVLRGSAASRWYTLEHRTLDLELLLRTSPRTGYYSSRYIFRSTPPAHDNHTRMGTVTAKYRLHPQTNASMHRHGHHRHCKRTGELPSTRGPGALAKSSRFDRLRSAHIWQRRKASENRHNYLDGAHMPTAKSHAST